MPFFFFPPHVIYCTHWIFLVTSSYIALFSSWSPRYISTILRVQNFYFSLANTASCQLRDFVLLILLFLSNFTDWLPHVVRAQQSYRWTRQSLRGHGICCWWGFRIFTILGRYNFVLIIVTAVLLLGLFLTFRWFFRSVHFADDGEHVSTRGRHSSSKKYKPYKRNICEAAASHQRLLGYL